MPSVLSPPQRFSGEKIHGHRREPTAYKSSRLTARAARVTVTLHGRRPAHSETTVTTFPPPYPRPTVGQPQHYPRHYTGYHFTPRPPPPHQTTATISVTIKNQAARHSSQMTRITSQQDRHSMGLDRGPCVVHGPDTRSVAHGTRTEGHAWTMVSAHGPWLMGLGPRDTRGPWSQHTVRGSWDSERGPHVDHGPGTRFVGFGPMTTVPTCGLRLTGLGPSVLWTVVPTRRPQTLRT